MNIFTKRLITCLTACAAFVGINFPPSPVSPEHQDESSVACMANADANTITSTSTSDLNLDDLSTQSLTKRVRMIKAMTGADKWDKRKNRNTVTSTSAITTSMITSTSVTTRTSVVTSTTEPCVAWDDSVRNKKSVDFDFNAYYQMHQQKENAQAVADADNATESVEYPEDNSSQVHYSVEDYNRNGNYLFIGDSRIVGMSMYEGMEYFAEVACGLDYFYENYDAITAYRDYNIVFCLGVNDLYRVGDYINMYQTLPEEFVTQNHIIVTAVTPCDGDYEYLNADIAWFNENIAANLPDGFEYMDLYAYLEDIGFSTADGLHYTGETYSDIYNAIVFGF